MATHTSATMREETPHENNSNKNTISNALRRRAQSVIKDTSIDPQGRALIRYALEIDDPLLPELVRRADARESIMENLPITDEINDDDSGEERARHWRRYSVVPEMSRKQNQQPYLCSWRRLKTPRIRKRLRTLRSTWHSLVLLLSGYALGVVIALITGICIGW